MIYYILYVYLLSRLWIYYKWNFEMGIVFEPKCWSVSYGCENWLSRLLPVKQIRFPISTTDGICFVIYVFSEQANFSTIWECKMASASSTSARNLFQDSKTRLSERVQVCNFNVSAFTCPLQANINSIGSLARQIQRGSKSQEILGQTVKNFAAVESTVISTENNIAKLQVLSCFLQFFIKTSLSRC